MADGNAWRSKPLPNLSRASAGTPDRLTLTEEAVHIHGANGNTIEQAVQRFWRDSKTCGIHEGTNEIHRLIIARSNT